MRRRQQQDYKTLKTLFPLLHRVNNFVMTKSVENFPLASTIFACKNYTCMVAHWSLNPSLSLFFFCLLTLSRAILSHSVHTQWRQNGIWGFFTVVVVNFLFMRCVRGKNVHGWWWRYLGENILHVDRIIQLFF